MSSNFKNFLLSTCLPAAVLTLCVLQATPAQAGFDWTPPEKTEAIPMPEAPAPEVKKEDVLPPVEFPNQEDALPDATDSKEDGADDEGADSKAPKMKVKVLNPAHKDDQSDTAEKDDAYNPPPIIPEHQDKKDVAPMPTEDAGDNVDVTPMPQDDAKSSGDRSLSINPFPLGKDKKDETAKQEKEETPVVLSPDMDEDLNNIDVKDVTDDKAPKDAPSEGIKWNAPQHFDVVEGFGKDMPLAMALGQIVPHKYAYSFGKGVNPGVSISWEGGKPWNEVLDDALKPLGLHAQIINDILSISKDGAEGAPAKAAPEQEELAPVDHDTADEQSSAEAQPVIHEIPPVQESEPQAEDEPTPMPDMHESTGRHVIHDPGAQENTQPEYPSVDQKKKNDAQPHPQIADVLYTPKPSIKGEAAQDMPAVEKGNAEATAVDESGSMPSPSKKDTKELSAKGSDSPSPAQQKKDDASEHQAKTDVVNPPIVEKETNAAAGSSLETADDTSALAPSVPEHAQDKKMSTTLQEKEPPQKQISSKQEDDASKGKDDHPASAEEEAMPSPEAKKDAKIPSSEHKDYIFWNKADEQTHYQIKPNPNVAAPVEKAEAEPPKTKQKKEPTPVPVEQEIESPKEIASSTKGESNALPDTKPKEETMSEPTAESILTAKTTPIDAKKTDEAAPVEIAPTPAEKESEPAAKESSAMIPMPEEMKSTDEAAKTEDATKVDSEAVKTQQTQMEESAPQAREGDVEKLPAEPLASDAQKSKETPVSEPMQPIEVAAPKAVPVDVPAQLQSDEKPAAPNTKVNQIRIWEADKGDNLKKLLGQWCEDTDVKLVWDSNKDYKLSQNVIVSGTLQTAINVTLEQAVKNAPSYTLVNENNVISLIIKEN